MSLDAHAGVCFAEAFQRLNANKMVHGGGICVSRAAAGFIIKFVMELFQIMKAHTLVIRICSNRDMI